MKPAPTATFTIEAHLGRLPTSFMTSHCSATQWRLTHASAALAAEPLRRRSNTWATLRGRCPTAGQRGAAWCEKGTGDEGVMWRLS